MIALCLSFSYTLKPMLFFNFMEWIIILYTNKIIIKSMIFFLVVFSISYYQFRIFFFLFKKKSQSTFLNNSQCVNISLQSCSAQMSLQLISCSSLQTTRGQRYIVFTQVDSSISTIFGSFECRREGQNNDVITLR